MVSNSSGVSSGRAREELRGSVREIVRRSGFDRVGFAAAGPAPGAERFSRWIERGFSGEMKYLDRSLEKRCDPTRVLAGARTVIAAAVHYRERSDEAREAPPAGTARIASYAQGQDYHPVLEARLARACDELRARHPAAYHYYVDTGPVLERDWAEQAGIGWIGKNCCSIDPDLGSYFFIAVILTTLELEPDSPSLDHCGSCRLCIDACPTDALVAPRELDARRCISYLTIEHRGPLPPDLEPHIGNLVFGCDICQEVCPFNVEERLSPDAELAPRPENRLPALEELSSLDAGAFRTRFPRSPVRRAKHEGFLRNVIAAIGSSKEPRAAELLERLAVREDVASNPTLSGTLDRALRRIQTSSPRRNSP